MTVDVNGTAQAWNDYYPYGMTMAGRNQINGSVDTRYNFTGKERDVETQTTTFPGLDYFGARYYDSWRGQWGQVDPLTSLHPDYTPYSYCYNNPMNLIDPFGMDSAYACSRQGSQQSSCYIDIGDNTCWGYYTGGQTSSSGIGGGAGVSGGNYNFGGNQTNHNYNQVPEIRTNNKHNLSLNYKSTNTLRTFVSRSNTILKEIALSNPKLGDLLNKWFDTELMGTSLKNFGLAINGFRYIEDNNYSTIEFTFDESTIITAFYLGGLPGLATGITAGYIKDCAEYYAPLFRLMEENHERVYGNQK